jgi:hypothetical protein
MSKYIISERQYSMILETGAANAAMDLDIYVQPVDRDTSHGNENIIDSIGNIIRTLKELEQMFKVGKKIEIENKNEIFQLDDHVKKIYDLYTKKV